MISCCTFYCIYFLLYVFFGLTYDHIVYFTKWLLRPDSIKKKRDKRNGYDVTKNCTVPDHRISTSHTHDKVFLGIFSFLTEGSC